MRCVKLTGAYCNLSAQAVHHFSFFTGSKLNGWALSNSVRCPKKGLHQCTAIRLGNQYIPKQTE